jgi:isoleucyl-tRNA synthetase
LYLLSSPAVRAESLKFSKTGVHSMMKEIIIPLKNTVNFFTEYYNLCKSRNGKCDLKEISEELLLNPINIWIINEYSKLREEYHSNMKEYNLKGAINVLPKVVEVINNGYIKLGRLSLKGNDGLENWIESLSTMYYLIKYLLFDFRAIMPFFCEQRYKELYELYNTIDPYFTKISIHLNNVYSENEYIKLSESKLSYANDFDIIYKILVGIYQLRGIHNISFKKPIKMIKIAVEDGFEEIYSNRYRDYLSFVSDEGNIMDISVINNKELNIIKEIRPIKSALFKKYGKEVSVIYDELYKMNTSELDIILQRGTFKDFELDLSLFNIKYDITLDDDNVNKDYVFKEVQIGAHKIILLVDKFYDEELDKKYYYRLVATKIQRCRKYAGLHPWDNIKSYYFGEPKYNLEEEIAQECISQITKVKLEKYTENKVFYEKKFDDLDIKLFIDVL